MKVVIPNRWTGNAIIDREAETLAQACVEGKANLREANLSEADLSAANLSAADLSAADLSEADLSEEQLRSANLIPIRDDLWAVLCASASEVKGLREALIAGQVDGSCYTGACSCLCGTLATVAHQGVWDRPALKPNSSRFAERWFLAIEPGHTPENSPIVKITVEWIDQWLALMRAAFGS